MSAPSPLSTREPPSTVMLRPEISTVLGSRRFPASRLPFASFKSPPNLRVASVSYCMLLLYNSSVAAWMPRVGEFQALLASSFMPLPSCTVDDPASTRLAPMMATPPESFSSAREYR